MSAQTAPSIRTVLLTLAAVVAVTATTLAACDSGPDLGPPNGWEAVSETQWIRSGADTTGAFRDLETIESMGIAEAPNDLIRYAREDMLFLFRTAPEVVDSVFNAEAAPLFDRPFRTGDAFQADLDETVENAKKVIVGGGGNTSIYRQATVLPEPAPQRAVYPDSLRTAGVSGRVSVQVRVTDEGQPVAVSLIDSVHPVLDGLVMRQAATSTFNPAWVVQGRQGGTAIPNYHRLGVTFE